MTMTTQEELLKATIEHQDGLVAYAYAMLRDWASAQDAVQEALLIVARKWETFKPGSEVLPWVRGIVRLRALDQMRARHRDQPVEEDRLLAIVDRQFQLNLTTEFSERLTAMKAALESCLTKVTDKARRLLMSFYMDKESCDELARREHRNISAIRVELFRIRQALRHCAERELKVGEV